MNIVKFIGVAVLTPIVPIMFLSSIEANAEPWSRYRENGTHYLDYIYIPSNPAYIEAVGPSGSDVDFEIVDSKGKIYKPNTWSNRVTFGEGKSGWFSVYFKLKKCESSCTIKVYHSWNH